MIKASDVTCGELSRVMQPLIHRYFVILSSVLALVTIWISMSDRIGGLGLALIAAGSLYPCFLWVKQKKPGLPITSLMGLQSLIIYGMPIMIQNESLEDFQPERITQAALQVFVFGAALGLGWQFTIKQIRPRLPFRFREFTFLQRGDNNRLVLIGLYMLGLSTLFLIGNMAGLLGILVGGTYPIVRAVADALGLGGGLISAYLIAVGISKSWQIGVFWALYAVHTFMNISNYTLFPATGMMMAVALGLFMGNGRLPAVFLVTLVSILSVLNLAKFDMRRQYWTKDTAFAFQSISDLPGRYVEWVELGLDRINFGNSDEGGSDNEGQRLSSRVNSLAIILRAQEAVLDDNIPLLNGETYAIIPPLFIPRFLWPDKPRTHEGMVILNIHFGQQTREESLTTYISWGLLPEAYANFGSILGPLIIGIILGITLGWVECWSRIFPLACMQTLIVLTFTINCASSFESVSSVWLTSVFQMIVALTLGMWFFSESKKLDRSKQ